MSIIVNGQAFASKAALKRRVQEILRAGLRVVDEETLTFLLSLFDRHPRAKEKIGDGVRLVRVVRVLPYNTTGFQIERLDGSTTDISYLECLTTTTPDYWFRACCRTAVVEQVQAAKQAAFATGDLVLCAITTDIVTRDSCHADHAPPWAFDAIVKAFVLERACDPAVVEYADGDGVCESRFADADLGTAFAKFHRERAQLRIVSKRANLSLLRKGS